MEPIWSSLSQSSSGGHVYTKWIQAFNIFQIEFVFLQIYWAASDLDCHYYMVFLVIQNRMFCDNLEWHLQVFEYDMSGAGPLTQFLAVKLVAKDYHLNNVQLSEL